jgi:hypothetical protein
MLEFYTNKEMYSTESTNKMQQLFKILLVVVGPDGRSDHDQQHCYQQAPTVNQRLLLQLL